MSGWFCRVRLHLDASGSVTRASRLPEICAPSSRVQKGSHEASTCLLFALHLVALLPDLFARLKFCPSSFSHLHPPQPLLVSLTTTTLFLHGSIKEPACTTHSFTSICSILVTHSHPHLLRIYPLNNNVRLAPAAMRGRTIIGVLGAASLAGPVTAQEAYGSV